MDVSRSFCFIFHTLSWTVLKAEGDWKSVRSPGTPNFYFFSPLSENNPWDSAKQVLERAKVCWIVILLLFFSFSQGPSSSQFHGCCNQDCLQPSHPWTAFPHLQRWDSEGCLSHLSLHQESVKRLLLMHLESGQDPLYPVVLPFWKFL